MNIIKIILVTLLLSTFTLVSSEVIAPTTNNKLTKVSEWNFFETARKYYAYGGDVSKKAEKKLKALASSGFNLNLANDKGETILHKAANVSWDKEQEFIIQLGVDPQIKNNAGLTAKNILDKRKKNNSLEMIIPIIMLLIMLVALVLSFLFRHKFSDKIKEFSSSWEIRFSFALISSFGIGMLISMIMNSNGNQFEGGKGLGILFMSFITVPASFLLLLAIKNPVAQVTLIVFSISMFFTNFLYMN